MHTSGSSPILSAPPAPCGISGHSPATPGEGPYPTPGEGPYPTPGEGSRKTPGEGSRKTPGEGSRKTPGGDSRTPPGGDTLHVRLRGDIDHFSAAPLRAILTAAAADGRTRLVLDCADVSFCDSALLGALALWQGEGRTAEVRQAPPAVRRLLALERELRAGPRETGLPPGGREGAY
ncbi:STAS domain-containing protein [Streptomyces griseosporeus]|uniref:STAS domain-containing protein n=1 Tax=Streptomyces griseosporeus TaxID=1910 RepID=UPI00167F006E|nr:STAS domain-containing protein [Streptomyces griseosporeus]